MRSVTDTRDAAAGGNDRVKVTGALRRVEPGRRAGSPVLQAELSTGPERVRLVWLGRERIPGIEPGRMLAVEGRVSIQHGRPTMFNPRYDLAPPDVPRSVAVGQ